MALVLGIVESIEYNALNKDTHELTGALLVATKTERIVAKRLTLPAATQQKRRLPTSPALVQYSSKYKYYTEGFWKPYSSTHRYAHVFCLLLSTHGIMLGQCAAEPSTCGRGFQKTQQHKNTKYTKGRQRGNTGRGPIVLEYSNLRNYGTPQIRNMH